MPGRPQRLPRRGAGLLAAGLAIAVVSLGAGCESSDGRALPPPNPATSAPAPAGTLPSEPFALQVGGVDQDGGELPAAHTCHGEAISPAVQWTGTPPAAELALVARLRDGGGTVFWVVGGIDPATTGFDAGGLPEGAVAALNAFDFDGWLAPCPSPGTTAVIDLSLHALPEPVTLAPDTPGAEAADLVEGASVDSAAITVVVTG